MINTILCIICIILAVIVIFAGIYCEFKDETSSGLGGNGTGIVALVGGTLIGSLSLIVALEYLGYL